MQPTRACATRAARCAYAPRKHRAHVGCSPHAVQLVSLTAVQEALRTKVSRERFGIEVDKMLRGTSTMACARPYESPQT